MRKLKPINKDIKNVKGLSKAILITLLKAITLLIKNILYIGYLLIYNFNSFIGKLYLKMPRIIRVGLIYTLLFMAIVNLITIDKTEAKNGNIEFVAMNTDIKYESSEELAIAIKNDNTNNEKAEETKSENKCNLGAIECKIFNKAKEYEMTDEQAYLLIAISKHETGNWTSSAFKNKNNFGGLMGANGLKSYSSFDDGLDAFVSLLKNRYFNKGLTTAEKIQPVYCPVGAKNDPNNLNKYWKTNVTEYYNEYLNK